VAPTCACASRTRKRGGAACTRNNACARASCTYTCIHACCYACAYAREKETQGGRERYRCTFIVYMMRAFMHRRVNRPRYTNTRVFAYTPAHACAYLYMCVHTMHVASWIYMRTACTALTQVHVVYTRGHAGIWHGAVENCSASAADIHRCNCIFRALRARHVLKTMDKSSPDARSILSSDASGKRGKKSRAAARPTWRRSPSKQLTASGMTHIFVKSLHGSWGLP